MKETHYIDCERCSTPIIKKNSKQRFCAKCSNIRKPSKPPSGLKKVCEYCNSPYLTIHAAQKFCTKECRKKNTTKEITEKWATKKIIEKPKNHKPKDQVVYAFGKPRKHPWNMGKSCIPAGQTASGFYR